MDTPAKHLTISRSQFIAALERIEGRLELLTTMINDGGMFHDIVHRSLKDVADLLELLT